MHAHARIIIDTLDTVTSSNTDNSPIVTLSSATQFNSYDSTPKEKKSQALLISISTVSGAIILSFVLIIACLVMVLKHIVRSERLSATCSSDSVYVYAELEANFPRDINNVEGESQNSVSNEPENQQVDYERISSHDGHSATSL